MHKEKQTFNIQQIPFIISPPGGASSEGEGGGDVFHNL